VRSQHGALIITERALHLAKRRAQRSAFRETGGLLLGFRVTRDVHVVDVHVVDVLKIRDPAATPTRFTLLEKRREDVLNKYLTEKGNGHRATRCVNVRLRTKFRYDPRRKN
jgi:hypothetical protein